MGRKQEDSDSSSRDPSSDTDTTSSSGSDQEGQNWVACDRCSKWRRIPSSFAKKLKEDQKWYCEHNPNKDFASCSVPQELTNEEIDGAEDADDSEESDLDEEEALKRRKIPAVWQCLRDNVLAHRKHKQQDDDDIMICHCKPPWRGGDCCGPDCINRMLCIECVPGFCPSEDKCTNQGFTKKEYAKVEVRRAGRKGFGLFALEDIKAGQFVIEYIGEVLEEEEYMRRKEYYLNVGQRHYYFMNIGNGEVIDACRKGNISRFINHSCEPNCETQKWIVRGELAIGLFAVRDIPIDTELTFDYNFERYGDKPMRCYCGSTNCRKFIGGAPDASGVDLEALMRMAVEPSDASGDLPPIMLTDADMDPHMRMLLDWRTGTKMERSKEQAMFARLEKMCKARGVPWTMKHLYGEHVAYVDPDAGAGEPDTNMPDAPSTAAAASTLAGSASSAHAAAGHVCSGKHQHLKPRKQTPAAAPVSSQQAAKPAATTASGGATTSKGPKPKTSTEALASLKLEDDKEAEQRPSSTVTPATAPPPPAPAVTPQPVSSEPQFRGPKALFKLSKIRATQQQDAQAASMDVDRDKDKDRAAGQPDKPAASAAPTATPAPEPPPAPTPTPAPTPMPAPTPKAEPLPEAKPEALAAAKHVPLRKRLRRLVPMKAAPSPPPPEAAAAAAPSTAESSAPSVPSTVAKRTSDGPGPAISVERPTPAAAPPAQPQASTSSAGTVPRKVSHSMAPPSAPPLQLPAPVSAPARDRGPRRMARSEIDRRLDDVVGPSGRLKDPSKGNIIKVLRMFNLCDIGGQSKAGAAKARPANGGYGHGHAHSNGAPMNGGYGDTPASPLKDDHPGHGGGRADNGPSVQAQGLTARQRARMADLSLLLDIILKTSSSTVKKDFVACGLLTQLHQTLSRLNGKEFGVILRKGLRVVEVLPLEANDVYAARSAHGTFADLLKQLSSSNDYDVRTKAAQLLKKYPASAVTDSRLLQRPAPASRGSHRTPMQGPHGSRLPPPPGMPHPSPADMGGKPRILRPLKSGAPEPAEGPGLHRTTSNGSLAEGDPMDMDAGVPLMGPGGPLGLPPTGPRHRTGRPMRPTRGGVPSGTPGIQNGHYAAPGPSGGRHGLPPPPPIGRMAPSPLGLPPRPPSPSGGDPSHLGPDDHHPHAKRHRHNSFGSDGFPGSYGMPFPGPPPLPGPPGPPGAFMPHMSTAHGRPGHHPSIDSLHLPGPPPLPHDFPGRPPSALSHDTTRSEHSAKPGAATADLSRPPELVTATELFALQRPVQSKPLPPAQGRPGPELHGEPTDPVILFALGIYGTYGGRPNPDDDAVSSTEDGMPMSPLIPEEPWSPLITPEVELPLPPPPPPLHGLLPPFGHAGPSGPMPLVVDLRDLRDSGRPLPGPPPGPPPLPAYDAPGTASGIPLLRPIRTLSQESPAGIGADWPVSASMPEGVPHPGFAGSMTPALAAMQLPGPPPMPPGGLAVPVSSLSDWQMSAPPPPPMQRPSPGPGGQPPQRSPELRQHVQQQQHAHHHHHGQAHSEVDALEEWSRPVSLNHPETWEEPNEGFEAYVSDMVRHRLGKYIQPEHPSRITIAEAQMLYKKVCREVVAKERRAWDERRSAGVAKPIERHKLEANLKEFVRSTIKRMRDRQREAAAGAGATAHQHHRDRQQQQSSPQGGAGAQAGVMPTPSPSQQHQLMEGVQAGGAAAED